MPDIFLGKFGKAFTFNEGVLPIPLFGILGQLQIQLCVSRPAEADWFWLSIIMTLVGPVESYSVRLEGSQLR